MTLPLQYIQNSIPSRRLHCCHPVLNPGQLSHRPASPLAFQTVLKVAAGGNLFLSAQNIAASHLFLIHNPLSDLLSTVPSFHQVTLRHSFNVPSMLPPWELAFAVLSVEQSFFS